MKRETGKFRAVLGIMALAGLLFFGAMPAHAQSTVEVYGEGAYTDTEVIVYLYADITFPILSCGVKLTYDPAQVSVTSAEKNEDVWYMGTSTDKQAYMDPETDMPGEVIIIGGKLNTSSPTSGVTGTRILLGTVTFSRTTSTVPINMGMDYARGGSYDNFVATTGGVLDGTGVDFNPVEIHERGDANGDGGINVNDMRELQKQIGNPDLPPWMDCNGDGGVNVNDMRWLQKNI